MATSQEFCMVMPNHKQTPSIVPTLIPALFSSVNEAAE